jgi:predicted short-subunit dehydrogenase-like oxidoreductase (DUF2520 family)
VGQVPVRYLLIGNGRLSLHLQHYFQLLDLPYLLWTRESHPDPTDCSHALLAIPDDCIEPFLDAHPELEAKIRVHFSGSLHSQRAWGAHPLMTFSHQLYDRASYFEIPFVVDSDAPDFSDLLPGLANPHYRLDPQRKARYHAECVLSGNFTALLWTHFFKTLESQLGLPKEAALPYLRQVLSNLQSDANPLTGPLVRGDRRTLRRNLRALQGDPYQGVYRSFVQAHRQS